MEEEFKMGNGIELEEKYYYRLVRDKVPELIEKSGKKATCRTLNDIEYKQALKDILVEKAYDIQKAETNEEIGMIIADITTINAALMGCIEMEDDDLIDCVNKKIIEKGFYEDRKFLISVEEKK